VNLWLEQENVWCSLAVCHCPLALYVHRNCQIGVYVRELQGWPRGGGRVRIVGAKGRGSWDDDVGIWVQKSFGGYNERFGSWWQN